MKKIKASRFEDCPQCGKQKRRLMACTHCGYSFIASKRLSPKAKTAKNKKATSQQKTEKVVPNKQVNKDRNIPMEKERKKIVRPYPSEELPDYDQLRSKNDIFTTGRVTSGGAIESGKNRKH
ncbi:50S ribosomal protein L32 [Methylomonas montana]|uniref:50S ribosomal protein L32 n=1 Tax=Methylomonas montana TaxID=3058963 RepID=UPI0026588C82|nr:50S ribosomal protein L32 [Methylomonas montana]WKJ89300.1 50S ribosomal protein L32 [Methylomonas montana]